MRVRSFFALVVASPALVCAAGCPDRDDAAPEEQAADEVRSDGEVLEAARALAQAVHETTLAVRSKLQDPEVQRLADEVLEASRAARERAMVLAQRLGIELRASPVSVRLEREAEARLARYEEKYGDVLEHDWLETELALHDDALGLLERQLLPAATAPEVRELLQDMRRVMTAHATRAEEALAAQGRG